MAISIPLHAGSSVAVRKLSIETIKLTTVDTTDNEGDILLAKIDVLVIFLQILQMVPTLPAQST